jgi:hypothetical protein
MFGPLFTLSILGKICPCLEKDEDRQARQAHQALVVAGQRVSWFTKASDGGGGVAQGARRLIGGLFGKKATVTPSTDSSIVEARLVFRDNDEGHPEILVDPLPRPSGQSVGYKLNLALYRIHSVQNDASTGEIRMLAKAPADPKLAAKLLCVVALLKNTNTPATAEEQDSFVHHLNVLTEWDRQRRKVAGLEDDEEEERAGNFLTQRAQKAAHFAKRELELQTTRRDREKRKAKLVAESGGLKYTALAMANRDDSEGSGGR